VRYQTQEWKNRVLGLIHHRVFQNFQVRLINLSQNIDELEMKAFNKMKSDLQKIIEGLSRTQLLQEKMKSLLREKLHLLKGKWERLCAELHNLSPLNILKKGYTLCWGERGKLLARKIDDVRVGEEMTVSFYKGEFTCLVNDIDREKQIESRAGKNK
jgi:exodeoxyribonuclease VII large subunit